MSSNLLSTVANYSGRQSDNQQSVKQFVTSITNQVVWFYKRLINGTITTLVIKKEKSTKPKAKGSIFGKVIILFSTMYYNRFEKTPNMSSGMNRTRYMSCFFRNASFALKSEEDAIVILFQSYNLLIILLTVSKRYVR